MFSFSSAKGITLLAHTYQQSCVHCSLSLKFHDKQLLGFHQKKKPTYINQRVDTYACLAGCCGIRALSVCEYERTSCPQTGCDWVQCLETFSAEIPRECVPVIAFTHNLSLASKVGVGEQQRRGMNGSKAVSVNIHTYMQKLLG